MTDHPRPAPPNPVKRVRIVQLGEAALQALAAGDLAAANQASSVVLTPSFVDPEWRGVWRLRSTQIAADPSSEAWITGVIWDIDRHLAVGRAGFHGPPDGAGMVEVGYAVDLAFRRQGYARAALEVMLERARRDPAVRAVRASIRPDNIPSLRLVSRYGFVEVGEQWDDEDGLETVFEVAVG